MADYPLALFSPQDIRDSSGLPPRWDDFAIRFLAQGDSWFSIGAMPPWATSNILQQIHLGFGASAINCAHPGRRLSKMVDWKTEREFLRLLAGKFAYRWDGILLSGGGNDLIAAAGVFPLNQDGTPVPPEFRLLLKPEEWGPESAGAARYLSDAGWTTFAAHLAPQFEELVARRDADVNAGVPLFCHTYACPTPRNAPAGPGMGPWLYPAFVAYGIPAGDRLATATLLIERLAALLRQIVDNLNQSADRHVRLIETHKLALTPADPASTGESGDWENEIHPTRNGYRKLAAAWRPVIEQTVPAPVV